MSVISNSSKGKKERIALAATENAKVCTSVRSKYFTVEASSPEESLSPPEGEPGAGETGAEDGDGKGSGTVCLSHLIKQLRSAACRMRRAGDARAAAGEEP